jgi:ribosomal protein L23
VNASKGSVIREVEAKYKVDVQNVRVLIIPGKKRRLLKTNRFIRMPKWKKVIVQIKEGQKIEPDKEKAKKPVVAKKLPEEEKK